MKDWDKILREIPTPPDSDEEDGLNEMKVRKNARGVSDALHRVVPALDSSLGGALPAGLNNLQSFTLDDPFAPRASTSSGSPPAEGRVSPVGEGKASVEEGVQEAQAASEAASVEEGKGSVEEAQAASEAASVEEGKGSVEEAQAASEAASVEAVAS